MLKSFAASSIAIVLAARPVDAAPVEISCTLQEDGVWNDELAAVTCNGVAGFFVASPRYRAMQKKRDAYDLLEAELRLTNEARAADRQAIARLQETIIDLKDAHAITTSAARGLLRDYEQMSELAQQAQRSAMVSGWERVAWYVGGALTVLLGAIAIRQAAQGL